MPRPRVPALAVALVLWAAITEATFSQPAPAPDTIEQDTLPTVGSQPGEIAESTTYTPSTSPIVSGELPGAKSWKASRTVTVVPSDRYNASAIRRILMGDLWRELWATPIDVPVLDLSTFAGGLTPTELSGGKQTASVRFLGADGVTYKFRSLDKDPSAVLEPELRETFVDAVVQDFIATQMPAAPVVARPFHEALDILHPHPVLAIMPDDPRLGEFRETFAGMLGTIEEHPDDTENEDGEVIRAFAGAAKVKSTENLYERLQKDNDEQVNAASFLKARLLDIYLNDWDRHQDQWRWARYDTNGRQIWEPIPRDRDHAFSLYNGLLPNFAERRFPELEGMEEEFPRIRDITWTARYLDKRFLIPLSREQWDSVTRFVTARITDSVIDAAMRLLPPSMYDKAGAALAETLQVRRDLIPEMSASYFHHVNTYPEVYGSDNREYVEVDRLDDGRVRVTLWKVDKDDGTLDGDPLFQRTFDEEQTAEIRIFLMDDDDQAIVRGTVDESIPVRIIGGDGADVLTDSSKVRGYFLNVTPIPDAERQTYFYDDGKKTLVAEGPSTIYSDRTLPAVPEELKWLPPRDYGDSWKPWPWLGYNSDEGFLLGMGITHIQYQFGILPYNYRVGIRGGYAIGANAFKGEIYGDSYGIVPGARVSFLAYASEMEILNFFGLGNESVQDVDLDADDYYNVRQREFSLTTDIDDEIVKNVRLGGGLEIKHTRPKLALSPILEELQSSLYGVENLTLFNGHAALTYDTRDHEVASERGFFFQVAGEYYPKVFDNEFPFSKARADARTFITWDFITRMTLGLRVAGEKVFGTFPFYEAAYLGGFGTLQGFDRDRYAGDAMITGNSHLRIHLFTWRDLLPLHFGLVGIGEGGRVYLNEEESDVWHYAYGGGITLGFLTPQNMLSLTVARSREIDFKYYVKFKYAF